MKNKISIKQIAFEADCGVGTVSRYLNGGYVSEEKKRIIKKIIDKYDYQPNYSAQSIRKQNTNVYILVPDLSSNYLVITKTIVNQLSGSDPSLNIFIIETTYDESRYLEICKEVARRNPKALILFNIYGGEKIKEYIQKLDFPIITYNQDWGKIIFKNDDAKIINTLLDRMNADEVLNNCERIYYIGEHVSHSMRSNVRHKAFSEWMFEHGKSFNFISLRDNSDQEIQSQISSLNFENSVIICGNNLIYNQVIINLHTSQVKGYCIADIGSASFLDYFVLPNYRVLVDYADAGVKMARMTLKSFTMYDIMEKTSIPVEFKLEVLKPVNR